MATRRVYAVVAVLALCAGVGAGPADARGGDGELVSEQELRERGPYRFRVAGVGEFEIAKIEPRRKLEAPCSVHVASVRDGIADRHRRGQLDIDAGETTNITLALSECWADDGTKVPCCKGAGELCTVSFRALRLDAP